MGCTLFHDLDCSLLEINPLVITDEGKVHCLDAKMNIDGNALYRQPKVEPCTTQPGGRARGRGRSSASTTSPWTAASAAWSTARVLRWVPWTWSSYMAATRELPRRRWRRNQRGGRRGVQDHPFRCQREGRSDQHLRRHRVLRDDRRRHHRRGAGRSASRCRWWCASKATMRKLGAKRSTTAA